MVVVAAAAAVAAAVVVVVVVVAAAAVASTEGRKIKRTRRGGGGEEKRGTGRGEDGRGWHRSKPVVNRTAREGEEEMEVGNLDPGMNDPPSLSARGEPSPFLSLSLFLSLSRRPSR